MDKKMLRQIPQPETKPEYIEMARSLQAKDRWLLQVNEMDGILQVIAWDADKLRNGKGAEARYRFFIGNDDYITQDLSVKKTKWLTGKASNILHLGYWNNGWAGTTFVNTQSRELFEKRFPPKRRDWWSEKVEPSPLLTLEEWQNTILQRRLNERYDRELAHTNQMMQLVPDLPEDFETWIHDYGMRTHRYLVYDGNSHKRIREAFCTECGQHMEIDSKKIRLRMNEWGECPCCSSPVVMKTIKRWHDHETGRCDITIVQKLDDGRLLFRCFMVFYDFHKKTFPLLSITKKQSYYEIYRVFIDGRMWESFEHAEYKTSRKTCWCPDTGKNNIEKFIIRRDGLRELLAGTPYQYSGIEVLQEKEEFKSIEPFRYLRAYEKCPELEMVVKAGLTRLAHEIMHDVLYWHYKGIPKELKTLSKQHLRMLRNMNGGKSMIDLLHKIELGKIQIRERDLEEFVNCFGPSERTLHDFIIHEVPVRKFTRYVMKQTGRRKKDISSRADFMHDWKDYWGWCEELGYDMHDEYVMMPPHFRTAHDRVLKELEARRDENMRQAMEEVNRLFEEQMQSMHKEITEDPIKLKSRKYMLVLPSSADDLKREGQTLHHCVATYADRVAKKQTMILFVRKVDAPEEPFFTMEWRDNRVIQCRGSHNCDMPGDVKAFVSAFEKQMQKAREEKPPRLKVRAG